MYIYAVIIIHNGRFRFLPSMCRLRIRSVAVLKRLAARTQPWRTPEEMENASEIVPFTLTTLLNPIVKTPGEKNMPHKLRNVDDIRVRKISFWRSVPKGLYLVWWVRAMG